MNMKILGHVSMLFVLLMVDLIGASLCTRPLSIALVAWYIVQVLEHKPYDSYWPEIATISLISISSLVRYSRIGVELPILLGIGWLAVQLKFFFNSTLFVGCLLMTIYTVVMTLFFEYGVLGWHPDFFYQWTALSVNLSIVVLLSIIKIAGQTR